MTHHLFHFGHSDDHKKKHWAQVAAIEARKRAERLHWLSWNAVYRPTSHHLGPKKRPLRLLSLDGGGVRGIISLIILERIMHDIAPKTKPCDYFDLIGGTSTGGLIAIMLGRLRMSIPECIAAYCELSKHIFDESLLKILPRLLKAHKFSGDKLKEAIDMVVKKQKGSSSTKMWDNPAERQKGEHVCRTFVVAVQGCGVNYPPKLFRTYNNRFQQQSADRCEIWEAARATSCAPSFFPDIEVEGIHYSDGGLGYNNPAELVLKEAQSLWGRDHEIGCLLSVGTGSKESFMHTFDNLAHLISLLDIFHHIALSCETVHTRLEHDYFVSRFYHRFNPILTEAIGLDEWTKIRLLKGIAWEYIGDSSDKIEKLGRSLSGKGGEEMPNDTEPEAPPPYERYDAKTASPIAKGIISGIILMPNLQSLVV
ncbi:hypothetical protein FRC04_006981 [Tulasnella sp. 424]|nr:hypothetical protein FRC04_006981 [Tulasnella sp. 424]KAG8966059.1 hypothetical protein FRC05_002900 [Tulasnella sp. 425]